MGPRCSIVRYEMPGRVEDAWRRERLRGACVDAQDARAALIEGRLVALERQAADDFREEDPRADLGADHARVLPNPANARVLRVHALLHGAGVDVCARVERLRTLCAHPREERVEPGAEHGVIIVAPCVPGDVGAARIGAFRRIRDVRVVNRPRDDHRPGGGENAADVGALFGRATQVGHLTRVPAREPGLKKGQFRKIARRRDTAQIESELRGLLLDDGGG